MALIGDYFALSMSYGVSQFYYPTQPDPAPRVVIVFLHNWFIVIPVMVALAILVLSLWFNARVRAQAAVEQVDVDRDALKTRHSTSGWSRAPLPTLAKGP